MIKKELNNFSLQQIADSGQCFRMKMTDPSHAVVIAHDRILEIHDNQSGSFEFDCSEKDFNEIWSDYFDLGTDYSSFADVIPPSDRFLNAAAEYGSGIRILKQDPFETLITFIISQRKNIPAIKSSVEKLCLLCGCEIENGIYAFPDPKAIAALSDEDLKRCSLGYRTGYVRSAANAVYHGDFNLSTAYSLDDAELFDALCSLHGVGKKVANCVMLFAYHRIDSFPVDVWIQRVIDEQYNGSFPLDLYTGFAGVIQQYMFFYGRTGK